MVRERVVITGRGAISPLGLNLEQNWQALLQGQSGIQELPNFDQNRPYERSQVRYYGFVRNFEDPKLEKRVERTAQFGLAVAREALLDAGLIDGSSLKLKDRFDPWRSAVFVGTGGGDTLYILDAQEHMLRLGKIATDGVRFGLERQSGSIFKRFGFKGPGSAISSACASSGEAFIAAVTRLLLGDADRVLVVGTDSILGLKDGKLRYPVAVSAYESLDALSVREREYPSLASMPFNPERDGFVMSEGAAALVLESKSHAIRRDAKIYGTVLGYCDTNDAYHDTALSGEGAIYAMFNALSKAGLAPEDVQYINPHATSTPLGDDIERAAMLAVFRRKLAEIITNPTKSLTGHLLGAAGAFEAVVTSLVLEHGLIPPTPNSNHMLPLDLSRKELQRFELSPDLACLKLDIPDQVRSGDYRVGMTNSFGFGGHNTVLVLGKYH